MIPQFYFGTFMCDPIMLKKRKPGAPGVIFVDFDQTNASGLQDTKLNFVAQVLLVQLHLLDLSCDF